jgi:hypothetical protein
VRLTPKAVSLNSFNGFYQSDGQEFFFKTHVEAHGVLHEYYHAQLLEKAGYNVVRPLRLVREKERQMVIYPVVKWPVMFELVRALETGQEIPAGVDENVLIEAEREECARLLGIYRATFQPAQTPSDLPPIHQLFWHRLQGERFQTFYVNKMLPLPAGSRFAELPFAEIARYRWVINGVEQQRSLDELVQQAGETLHPARAMATVVGHGDAHFGNVFLQFHSRTGSEKDAAAMSNDFIQKAVYSSNSAHTNTSAQGNGKTSHQYLYFDPAFAGRHSPLLDIVKPLYHNVFATWMYFPQEVARDLRMAVQIEEERIIVEHNYRLTPLRRALLQTKYEHLLAPLVAWLEEQCALPEDWQEFLNLALMCCPLLTINLFDGAKAPPEVGWLGLAQAVQLGNSGIASWLEDTR